MAPKHKDPTNGGGNRNSYDSSRQPRAPFDESQAGERVPYYPEFDSLDSSFSVGINQRNYLGSTSDERPRSGQDLF